MKRLTCIALIALTVWGGSKTTSVNASPPAQPSAATAYELIEAVNNLRTSQGLAPYSINFTLMNVAQAHSDYQAAIGSVTHYGPGGSSPSQRALAAGYPVAGDLSLGGFYSENIMGGSNLSAQSLVNAWSGDAPHLGTMTSPNLTEVGAGVACAGSSCYYTLDAAQSTGGPIVYTPGVNVTPGSGATSIVVFPNTPEADGSIKHSVRAGETLWTIAQAYGASVDDIAKLNRISATTVIYVGDVLIIRAAVSLPSATVSPTSTIAATFTPFVFWTITNTAHPTSTQPAPSAVDSAGGNLVVIIIIVAAFVLAGVLTAASARKRNT